MSPKIRSAAKVIAALQLLPETIATLEKRPEGWITGLHLAALSMQIQCDRAAFVRSLGGSNAFILDYLVEEVLQHQPPSAHPIPQLLAGRLLAACIL